MQIDYRHNHKEIRQFASQMERVMPHVRKQLEGMFNNDQPDEFYVGLLTGLASSLVMTKNNMSEYLPVLVSFIAERIEKKEIV